MSNSCIHCGGWCGVLGDEPTVDMYADHLVLVFREVRRVLRDDGIVWLNIGNSYAGSGKGWSPTKGEYVGGTKQRTNAGSILPPPAQRGVGARAWKEGEQTPINANHRTKAVGFKDKDLIPTAWLAGLALLHDGWYLRSDVIWSKTNVMPESTRDRPTKSHEYVLMLTKSRSYYYDTFAARESTTDGKGLRNKRSVWTTNNGSGGYKHTAAFHPALVEPCLRASMPEGRCCPECGAAYARITEKLQPPRRDSGSRPE